MEGQSTDKMIYKKDTVTMGIVADGISVTCSELKHRIAVVIEEGCPRRHNWVWLGCQQHVGRGKTGQGVMYKPCWVGSMYKQSMHTHTHT